MATQSNTGRKSGDDPNAQLKDDIEALKDAVARLTESLKARGADEAEGLGAKAGAAARNARERVETMAEDAAARGRQAVDDVGMRVREHPLQSLLLAFGLGVLIALLTRRG